MKSAVYLLLLLLLTSGGALSAPTAEVRIGGFGAGGQQMEYFVPIEALPCAASWRPQEDPFPEDLGRLVTLAVKHLAESQQLGGPREATKFLVQSIRISRLHLNHKDIGPTGPSEAQLTDQWIVSVTFYGRAATDFVSSSSIPHKNVVMLLDGTYATERAQTFRRPQWANTNQTALINSNYAKSSRKLETGSGALSNDPLSETMRADFAIPRVQWNPITERFPLDLNEQCRRARSALSGEPGFTQDITLSEVHLSPFIPGPPHIGAAYAEVDNQHHWVMVFTYGSRPQRVFEAYLLMDGRVLEAAERVLK